MAFSRPTLKDLVTRVSADMESRLLGGQSLLRRAVVKVLARVQAGALYLQYGYLDWIAKQAMPDSADPENLARWAKIWGVTKKPAIKAVLNVTLTGTSGTLIPALTEIQRTDGIKFQTDANATISGGTVTTSMTAALAGIESNTDVSTVVSLTSPIAGVSSSATIAAGGVDGTDEESDALLLSRLLGRIQEPPQGGAENDYIEWALECSGVTRAWCYSNYLGAGTVGVVFVRDNDASSIIPDSGEVAVVQTYLDDPSRKPVTADVHVLAPVADTLNFTISGVADLTVRAAIQAELKDLLLREGVPGGTLLLSHINEAISKAQDEVDHVLVSPAANVVSSTGHIPVFGAITWL